VGPGVSRRWRRHDNKPEKITFLSQLPKARSGKIMRRVLRARALGRPEGDVTTLEE
jgi:acetyl-CoA synthetase